MGTGHSHAPSSLGKAPPRVRLILAVCLVPFAVAVVVGMVALWPEPLHDKTPPELQGQGGDLVDATVVSMRLLPCAGGQCMSVVIEPSDGPERGNPQPLPSMQIGSDVPTLQVGDLIVAGRAVDPTTGAASYYFADQQRTTPLVILALVFAVVVIAVARIRGVAAIVGLAFSYLVIVRFLLPGLLEQRNPVLVALVAAGAILFVMLYLAHGFNARTSAALLGTLVSLLLTGLLAWMFVGLTKLSGLTSDEAAYIKTTVGTVDLRGVLLAGIIIGALGVLNDVTVTQAAAVWEIHDANPERGWRASYRAGMRIGRDHIASAVDTLVLAYAGASLPLLIVFTLGTRPISRILTGDIVAEEIVRTLVGSIGLVASVPLTTMVAALVAAQAGSAMLGGGGDEVIHLTDAESDYDDDDDDHDHGHGHGHDDPEQHDHDHDPVPDTSSGAHHLASTEVDDAGAATQAVVAADEPAVERGARRRADDWQPPKAERDFWGD